MNFCIEGFDLAKTIGGVNEWNTGLCSCIGVSLGITDVVVVVVRYFGGIKLGTSGLIVAYRTAAREALDSTEIVERHIETDISFTFPYLSMNGVMKLTKRPGVRIVAQTFDNTCALTLRTRADDAPALLSSLTDIDGVSLV